MWLFADKCERGMRPFNERQNIGKAGVYVKKFA